MNVAFTLCSINYLAQAKSLYESIKKSNPSWRFIIGIVDKNTQKVDLSFLDCELLWVDKIEIDGFNEMVGRYTIVELLTSVKPFYFKWLFDNFEEVEKVVYFDPDILVLQSLESLDEKLNNYDIILTPHFTTPIKDNFLPTELHVMQTGIYNLGFLAVSNSLNSKQLMNWWCDKLRHECLINLSRGLFVDQLWMNLAPTYFDKVLIDKYPGYNMAHWNIHERYLTKYEGEYLVNGVPLVFFHFSHYSPAHPEEIAAYHTRFNFNTRTDLKELYEIYHNGLVKYHYFELKKVSCYYMKDEKKKKRKRNMENFLRVALPSSLKGYAKKIMKAIHSN